MAIYDFLSQVKGVIHIGASKGQERKIYRNHDIDVLFVEAIPFIFERLKRKIRGDVKYIALNCLVTNKDDEVLDFHIASNRGMSSSIFDFADHKKIWENISMVSTIQLKSISLPTMLTRHHIDIKKYDALVLDTQGSELLILQGAETIISQFQYIVTEVCDFEAYEGCCRLNEMDDFMKTHDFETCHRFLQVKREGIGSYWDILYKRRA